MSIETLILDFLYRCNIMEILALFIGMYVLHRKVLVRLDEKINPIKDRMDNLDNRMDNLDKRMDGMEKRMDNLDKRMDRLEDKVDHLTTRVDDVDRRVCRIEGTLTSQNCCVLNNGSNKKRRHG